MKMMKRVMKRIVSRFFLFFYKEVELDFFDSWNVLYNQFIIMTTVFLEKSC